MGLQRNTGCLPFGYRLLVAPYVNRNRRNQTFRMKRLFAILKQKFHKVNPVHNCEFKCSGWCSHFNQVSEIADGLKNPTWYHYPSATVMERWMSEGFDYARVMQSHWNCTCGKHFTYFFLAKPSKGYGGKIPQPDNISQATFDEMITYNPFARGASRGSSLSEVTKELIQEFC